MQFKSYFTKQNVKTMWKLSNDFMGVFMSLLVFLQTNDVMWAVVAYPVARTISEYSTKLFNYYVTGNK